MSTIAWEMKLLCLVIVYAIFKFIRSTPVPEMLVIFAARAFFVFGHVYFFYLYRVTNAFAAAQARSSSLSPDKTAEATASIWSTFQQLLMRSVAVIIVHFQFNMLPPLVISVLMGLLTMLESKEFARTIRGKIHQN